MTLRDFLSLAGNNPYILLGIFIIIPVLSWLIGMIHGRFRGGMAPWKYFYSLLIYLVCIPGIFASVVTAYSLFFHRENLLDVNILAYFLPIISMIATLVIIGQNVEFASIPGFDRLSGLMVMIAVSFAIALAIQKTRLFLFFGGSITMLIVIAVIAFALLKWGAYMMFKGKNSF
jgi:hypothetical protein